MTVLKWTLFVMVMLIMWNPEMWLTFLAIFALLAIPYALLTNLFGPAYIRRHDDYRE